MIAVPITEEMKAIAEAAEATKLATIRSYSTTGNYTGLNAERRFYIGVLGELAFLEVLAQAGKRADYIPVDDGIDSGDFILYCNTREQVIDVKTASKSYHQNLFMPEKQADKYQYDGYVGVRLLASVAEVWGYCTRDDFVLSTIPSLTIPTLEVRLDALVPVEILLEDIMPGETNSRPRRKEVVGNG